MATAVTDRSAPAANDAALTLRVAGLTVAPPRISAPPILDGISLSIGRGEILGIVGGSGSGKSTLARCLLRLEAPLAIRAGRILFGDRDLASLRPREMRRLRGREIAMVPQDPIGALDPVFTLDSQLREFAATHADALSDPELSGARPTGGRWPARVLDRAIAERLSGVRLNGDGRRQRAYPHQWSRGMLQRMLCALASWPSPGLLVLDEPTAALDLPVADLLLADLSQAVRRHGVAVLLITHDLAVAVQVCDRIAVLEAGRIVETAPALTLLREPRHERTRDLVAGALW